MNRNTIMTIVCLGGALIGCRTGLSPDDPESPQSDEVGGAGGVSWSPDLGDGGEATAEANRASSGDATIGHDRLTSVVYECGFEDGLCPGASLPTCEAWQITRDSQNRARLSVLGACVLNIYGEDMQSMEFAEGLRLEMQVTASVGPSGEDRRHVLAGSFAASAGGRVHQVITSQLEQNLLDTAWARSLSLDGQSETWTLEYLPEQRARLFRDGVLQAEVSESNVVDFVAGALVIFQADDGLTLHLEHIRVEAF
jgi:hypothetical protein